MRKVKELEKRIAEIEAKNNRHYYEVYPVSRNSGGIDIGRPFIQSRKPEIPCLDRLETVGELWIMRSNVGGHIDNGEAFLYPVRVRSAFGAEGDVDVIEHGERVEVDGESVLRTEFHKGYRMREE